MKKSIYIAYTGGTIGMKRVNGRYQPVPGFLQQQMAQMVAFQHPDLPDYTIQEYVPLLDSTNMTPADWSRIARDIAANYDRYDGFIVLHGTDTMAYTASALAFMLKGLDKTVILTGSQIPLCEVRNDARDNLVTSLMLAAADLEIPEVCLYFHGRLFRGCRAVKVDAGGFGAFDSPNFPPLAEVGIDIHINRRLIRPLPDSPLEVRTIEGGLVAALRLFPGISAHMLDNMLHRPLRGLVLETYGAGNAPTNDKQLLRILDDAINRRQIVIVDCTQCLRGSVNLHKYETGSALAAIGVISGYDMTAEAALTKLAYLLSGAYGLDEVKQLMQTDLRGELTAS